MRFRADIKTLRGEWKRERERGGVEKKKRQVNPTQHSMTRRAAAHDYSRPGTYHITLHVAEGRGCPLGTVTGDPMAADGSPEAPRVALSPVGRLVEEITDEKNENNETYK